jgi:hypothetical protein
MLPARKILTPVLPEVSESARWSGQKEKVKTLRRILIAVAIVLVAIAGTVAVTQSATDSARVAAEPGGG